MDTVTQSESVEYIPKQALRIFTEVLLDPDINGNKSEVERRTGIRRDRFNWNHKYNAEFRLWFEAQCDRALTSYRAKADSHLRRNIEDGSDPALRTYYEIVKKIKNPVTQQAINIDARDTQAEINIYPQFNINYVDAIPINADQPSNGDRRETDTRPVHAEQGPDHPVKRLPL